MLLKLLTSAFSSGDESISPRADRPSSLHIPEEVTDPDQISSLLQKLHESHSLLAVRLRGIDDIFMSAIIEVSPQQRYIVLDELAPAAGAMAIKANQRVLIRSRLNNVTIEFESEVTDIGTESGLAFYRLPYPSRIHYKQRRTHFRASVPIEKQVPLQIVTPQEHTLHAELRDISLGGFSGRFRSGYLDDLETGLHVPRCVITLPNKHKICCSVQILYLERMIGFAPRVGARYVDLDRRDHRQLEQYIAQLDREFKRKQLKG
jgi:c-di-GMP-binding flagellar brake protein YcgR